MTARNYGLSRRQASVGGGSGKPAGALAQDTPRDSISFPSGPSFKRRKISQPSFDERELSAGFLFFAMVVAPLLFVGLIVLCHRTFG